MTYCRNCPTQVSSVNSYCAACRPREIVTEVTKKHALPHGEWVLDPARPWRRIFQEMTPPPAPAKPGVKREYTRPCPLCGAEYGQACRMPSGGRTAVHLDRLEAIGIYPECPDCGGVRDRMKKFCDLCRASRRRAAWRRSQARARQKREAA